MREFLKSFSASLLALCFFAGGSLLLVIVLAVAMKPDGPTVPNKAVLVFNLGTPIPDCTPDGDPSEVVGALMGQGGAKGLPVRRVVEAIDRAAKDNKISALYLTGNVTAGGYTSGLAALKEVKEAIGRFKATGKPVIAHNQAFTKRDLYLCAGATTLSLNPMGGVDMTGLSAEPMFFAGALKKAGIEVQVTRVGKYKSAVEPFILDKMSEPNREQLKKFITDIWEDWKASIATDRKRTPESLQALADQKGPLLATEALAAGLVDRLATEDEVLDELKKLAGKQPSDREFPQMDLVDYAGLEPAGKGSARIALVVAEGEIVDGDGEARQVGGDRLARELRRLRLDKDVKAVVIRVNSPGGSALASEIIQRETVLLKKEKPVIISMGAVAASGGYWISAYADRIFAQPNTLTGSIGVFGMLPNAQKLMGTLGISVDGVKTSQFANVQSLARPKSPEELARIQSMVDDIYERFLTKVSEGRKLDRAKVAEIAQGRIWSGIEARRLGLVDELGGLGAAIQYAAKAAKVEGDFRLDTGAPARGGFEKLMEMLGDGGRRKVVRTSPVHQLKADLLRQLDLLASLNDPRGVYARVPLDLTVQ